MYTLRTAGDRGFLERCLSVLRRPLSALALAIQGKQILLAEAATLVGRSRLGGTGTLSSEHAFFYRRGPLYRLEDSYSNGTFRRLNGAWVRLPKRQPVLVKEGDIPRFADVEARVVTA